MKNFEQWLSIRVLSEELNYDSAKKIVFNAIKADPKAEDSVLSSKLSVFDDKDAILKQSALKKLPNYDSIITAVSKMPDKTTVNQLIQMIVSTTD